MKNKLKKKPSPEDLLAEVQGQQPTKTYEFEDYLPVIHALQQKGYSYAGIAEYIKERLGFIASRGQVYRAYQSWLAEQSRMAETAFEEQPDAKPKTDQEEYDERLRESAVRLIESMQIERDRPGGIAPWDEPDDIIVEAAAIITERHKAEVASENAASEADKQIEAKKRSSASQSNKSTS